MAASPTGAVALALLLTAAPAEVLQQGAPGPPHETLLTVGEAPPTGFTLESIDDESFSLEEALGERPLLLLFFRGTW